MATIKSLTKLNGTHEGLCIEVDNQNRLFAAGGKDGRGIFSHNSVVQRNIIVSCIMRPRDWAFIGVDLKRVELSAYRKYSNVVLGIATTLEDALQALRFAQMTMMKRYTEMEQLGYNNFLDLPQKGRALMVMVDECGELLSPSGVKALVANTLVYTADHELKPLSDIKIGDKLLDPNFQVCTVDNKYEPIKQDKFDMTFSEDNTGNTEVFTAGSEHYWPCYLFSAYTGKQLTGELKLTTKDIFELKQKNDTMSNKDKVVIKLKRKRVSFDAIK